MAITLLGETTSMANITCCLLVSASLPQWGFPLIFDTNGKKSVDACSMAIGIENEGFVFSPTLDGGSYTCTECRRIESRTSPCPPPYIAGGERAYQIVGNTSRKTYRRDGCNRRSTRGFECLGCPAQTTPLSPVSSAVIHGSSDCHHIVPGNDSAVWVNSSAASHYTLNGHGGTIQIDQLPFQVSGDVVIEDGTIVQHPSTETPGEVHEVAIWAPTSGNLTITNVDAPTSQALVSVRPKSPHDTDVVKGISVSGSAILYVASLSHVKVPNAIIQVGCTNEWNRVLIQQLKGDKDFHILPLDTETSTHCNVAIDISLLFGMEGRRGEIEFENDGVDRPEVPELLRVYVHYLVLGDLLMTLVTLFGHEGDFHRAYQYIYGSKKLHTH